MNRFIKGDSLNRLNKYQEAIELYDQAIQIDPSNINAINDKGVSLLKLKQYDEAINCFGLYAYKFVNILFKYFQNEFYFLLIDKTKELSNKLDKNKLSTCREENEQFDKIQIEISIKYYEVIIILLFFKELFWKETYIFMNKENY